MKQIFVIGKNRSGTKWLANLLANHPKVAALQREGAGGILEVNELAIARKVFGPAEVEENFLGFLACFLKSNAFKVSGLREESFFEKRHSSYAEFFGGFMDAFAAESGKDTWVQKTSSFSLSEVLKSFPEAKIIVIQRMSVADNVASTLALSWQYEHGSKGKNLFKEVWSYVHHRKLEEVHRGNPNVRFTSFENLKADKDAVCRNVCSFLDLEFEEEMLQDAYAKNTSFSGEVKKDHVLSPFDKRLVTILFSVVRWFPLVLFNRLRNIRLCLRKGRLGKRSFQRHTFSIFKEEIGWK
ncbi:MAG: sulfotransferase [Opitutales bacterium]|nr:sulfotransferase [Opitutales bacterium]